MVTVLLSTVGGMHISLSHPKQLVYRNDQSSLKTAWCARSLGAELMSKVARKPKVITSY